MDSFAEGAMRMACRTALLCLLAATPLAGCGRPDAPLRAAGTVARAAVGPAGDRRKGERLAEPVLVEVGGKPLVRDGGGLVPFVGDIDGDGRPDLLLGTPVPYGDGRLLVYRNVGSKGGPRLTGPQWFDDTVPTGRIPRG
jgi:hypothetical protein